MIFATVGTHAQPFPRLVDALAHLDDEVVVQYGRSHPPAGIARADAFMSFTDVAAHMRAARAVVTHAGVGSILSAREAGHVPVVVPRLRRLGEHVDDHQAELTRALEARGDVLAVWDVAELPEALRRARQVREGRSEGDGDLQACVRAALLGS